MFSHRSRRRKDARLPRKAERQEKSKRKKANLQVPALYIEGQEGCSRYGRGRDEKSFQEKEGAAPTAEGGKEPKSSELEKRDSLNSGGEGELRRKSPDAEKESNITDEAGGGGIVNNQEIIGGTRWPIGPGEVGSGQDRR